jgi:hypothetical protein
MKTAPVLPAARRPRQVRRLASAAPAAVLTAALLAAGTLAGIAAAAGDTPTTAATQPASSTPPASSTQPASSTPPAASAPAATPTPPAAVQPPAKAPAPGKSKSKAAAGKGAKPAKSAPAPPPAPPKPPVPNAALAQLKPLAGSWTCTGRTFGPGPEHATSGALIFAWQLDGFWLEARSEEQKATANPVPVSSISYWGYDDLQQSLAATSVDNLGGTAAQTTAGWQGDKLVLEGPARRYSVQFQARDTFVRHGETQLAHTLEADVNGSWVKLHEDTCQRVPAK